MSNSLPQAAAYICGTRLDRRSCQCRRVPLELLVGQHWVVVGVVKHPILVLVVAAEVAGMPLSVPLLG
jgi:hypothetical protein